MSAGSRTNTLFICSKNKWRSPTAEKVYANDPRINVRSRGTSKEAVKKLSQTDLDWAQIVICMEKRHATIVRSQYAYVGDIAVLDIPDDYSFMDDELVTLIRDGVEDVIAGR